MSFKKSRSAIFLAAVFALSAGNGAGAEDGEPRSAGRFRKVADPAEALRENRLSEEESKQLRGLFQRLASDDFDDRQRARAAILQYGPRAASVAKTFESHDDMEIRQFARSFQQFLILHYRGYLPTDPELKTALETRRRVFIGKQESFRSALERLIRDSELAAAFSWKNCPERVIGSNEVVELNLPTGKALDALLNYVGMEAVPRGRGIAGVTHDQMRAMIMQEHDFPAASLAPARRERLVAVLSEWLPHETKFESVDTGIRVRGTESDVRQTARAIYFLLPDALKLPAFEGQSAVVPAAPDSESVRALFDALEAPVAELSMAGIEPLRGIARLRAAGHPLGVEEDTPELVPLQPAVALELRGLPLGLALRWLVQRANVVDPKSPSTARLELRPLLARRSEKTAATGGSKTQIIARLLPVEFVLPLSESVGYSDVSFLFTDELTKLAADDADAAAVARIRSQFDGERALFPAEESDFAMFVFNRRLIARGPAALLARLNAFVQTWRETKVPPLTKWREEARRLLRREVDWNGRDLTVGTLLPRLRDVTGLNILLDRSAGGTAFEIDARDAELLPPGKHSAKDLLLRLGVVSKAQLVPRWGVIVLSPAQSTPETPMKLDF